MTQTALKDKSYELEQVLLQAHSLLELAMSQEVGQPRHLTVRIAPTDQAVLAAAEELTASARHELVAVLPQRRMSPACLQVMNGSLNAVVKRGVKVRLLWSPDSVGITREPWFADAVTPEVELRVANCSREEIIIVDGNAAIVHGAQPDHDYAIILHQPAIANALQTLMNSIWDTAIPAPRGRDGVDEAPTAKVLGCLASGQTDESAARELGVSVRTYRRYVARIMQDIGATSRFQAGVLAGRLGLVPHSTRG
ncbi:helix-turn-helix transcriptional regulator [Saccharothrix algeriensis]|uniref:DNA-binding CsgD family transcriptional regulator n=1 Tax=Saccharothrix algeriensis TaxID=173560 RepID=A0ABS2S3X4_9PSEU|nr:TrmB family transcriptional regulator sugar-binding domain-containing protein [Saccharothrix algeriensis]MBM7810389.1 DNA-binding CsgD family transcriptional regulator [Saccharothrix algeriensis]